MKFLDKLNTQITNVKKVMVVVGCLMAALTAFTLHWETNYGTSKQEENENE